MRVKRILGIAVPLLAIALLAVLGGLFFPAKAASWTALCIAILSCVPFLLNYEFRQNKNGARELTVLAVLIGLSALGRFVFAWLPGFKPMTAIAVLAAVYLGKEAGFLIGSLSVIVSNFYFGQGPWTPFQMFAFGLLGFLAGLLAGPLRRSRIVLALYGIFSGVFFSLIMDVWSALWMDGALTLRRYLALCISALPFIVEYAVSNVVFLLLLVKPAGILLERIKTKYGIFLS